MIIRFHLFWASYSGDEADNDGADHDDDFDDSVGTFSSHACTM